MKKIVKNLGDLTKARFLVALRDSSENFKVEYSKECEISLSKITEKSEAEKKIIFNKLRTALIPEIRKSGVILDYKNLV